MVHVLETPALAAGVFGCGMVMLKKSYVVVKKKPPINAWSCKPQSKH